MNDLIERQKAIDALCSECQGRRIPCKSYPCGEVKAINALPPAQPEIIHCKDCKYYSPMNKETKTGICNLAMHQNFGDNWFCAGAERRTDDLQ